MFMGPITFKLLPNIAFLSRLILAFFIFNYSVLLAQNKSIVLLNDPEIQFEVTEAMNQMYNFQFLKADSQFYIMKRKYPNHPLPFFLLGYSQYWRIMPNEESENFDPKFMAYMDTVIDLADKIYSKDNKNFEALFFLAGANAFRGRRLSDREKWTAATFAGRNALKYLRLSREYNELSPEFLFGEGLFNYYSAWIPENYKALKPLMWFFPKGEKKTGIEYLKQASSNAFYTRVEAQHYLTRILIFEEKRDAEALPIIQYLNKTYPSNPVFHRLYARLLFSMGSNVDYEKVSLEILNRINEKWPGYEETSGRYASFFLGWTYRYTDREKSKIYFKKSIEYSEKIGAVTMNYYYYSLSALAKMADEDKDKQAAKIYYKKIKDNAGRSHEMHKEARKYLKEND